MKKILLVLSLLLATPTFAAQSYGSGNINDAFSATLVAVNDQICYNNVNLATKLATVQWTVTTAGSGGITVQISRDYGTNSIPGVPYSVLTSTISANPSTAPWVNNSPVVGSYETPIPAGTTNFCILYQTGGTATTITLAPGKPYVAGTPVVATLYDITSAVNTDNPTGTLDFGGWVSSTITFKSGGATTVSLVAGHVADDGVVVEGAYTLVAAAVAGQTSLNRNAALGSGQSVLSKRMNFDVAPVAAQQTRLHVEASR